MKLVALSQDADCVEWGLEAKKKTRGKVLLKTDSRSRVNTKVTKCVLSWKSKKGQLQYRSF
jgi:hypothetical protein